MFTNRICTTYIPQTTINHHNNMDDKLREQLKAVALVDQALAARKTMVRKLVESVVKSKETASIDCLELCDKILNNKLSPFEAHCVSGIIATMMGDYFVDLSGMTPENPDGI